MFFFGEEDDDIRFIKKVVILLIFLTFDDPLRHLCFTHMVKLFKSIKDWITCLLSVSAILLVHVHYNHKENRSFDCFTWIDCVTENWDNSYDSHHVDAARRRLFAFIDCVQRRISCARVWLDPPDQRWEAIYCGNVATFTQNGSLAKMGKEPPAPGSGPTARRVWVWSKVGQKLVKSGAKVGQKLALQGHVTK